jgi:iron(III) transport system permease protein
VLGPLSRSIVLGVAVALASGVVGTTAAFLVTRSDLPGRRVWAVVLPLPLVIPSFVAAIALIAAFAPGGLAEGILRPLGLPRAPLVQGFTWSLLLLSLISYPYVYLPVAARLRHLPPSLEEAARSLGRRPAEVFRTVVLPQAKGAVAAGMLLAFLYTISDFGAVSLLRYDTLTRAIYTSRLLNPTRSLTLGFLLGLIALLVVAGERVLSRQVRGGPAARTGRGLRVPLGRWKLPATGFVAAVVGLALAVPLGVLGFWAARGLVRGSARQGAAVTDLGVLVRPALNTATVSVAAAAIAVAVVLPLAYQTVRHRSRIGSAAHALVVGGFALPGLSLALALVYWTVATPFYGTLSLVIGAYVIHFGAQALRAAQVAIEGVPKRMDEAARALGAGRVRRLRTIDLPLMAPGLLAGGGLVLLSAMKELPATLLLAPPGFETLAMKIWTNAEDSFLADASLASLALVAISSLLTWVLVVRRAELLD